MVAGSSPRSPRARRAWRLLGLIDPFARPPDRLDLRIGRAKLVGAAALAGADSPPSPPPRGSKRKRHFPASPAARRSSGGNRLRWSRTAKTNLPSKRRVAAAVPPPTSLDRRAAGAFAALGSRISVIGMDIRAAPGFVSLCSIPIRARPNSAPCGPIQYSLAGPAADPARSSPVALGRGSS